MGDTVKDVAIDKASAPGRMSEILAETETLLADMEAGYSALAGSIAASKGDFIDALKAQITSEQEVVQAACSFYKTLLEMMMAAEVDFGTLDQTYAEDR